MKNQIHPSRRLRNPIAPKFFALAFGLGLSCHALADTTTLTVSDATIASRNVPVTLDFPIARSGDTGYDTVLTYHSVDGSAVAGIDYTLPAQSIVMPAGAASANVPVTIAAHAGGPDQTFQLVLDAATGIGPAPAWAAQMGFSTGTQPRSVAVADVNGDGLPDLIVANSSSNTLSVLLNTTAPGASIPSFAAKQNFATGTNPYSVAVADLNGDGRPDLVVTNQGGGTGTTLSVLLNTSAPGATTLTFATQQTFNTGTNPQFVVVSDVNGDGVPDLIVANYGDSTVSVLINTTPPGNATPTFAAQQAFATGSRPISIAVRDVNGDGKPDVIVANFMQNSLSVLRNTTLPGATMPGFAAQQTFATGTSPVAVTAADVNGDGKADLIVANRNDNTASVLLNTTATGATTLSFASQQTFATGSTPLAIAAADLDGDGKADLVVANLFGNTVSVLHNTTAPGAAIPSFAAQQASATGSAPGALAVADFNGDGKVDVVAANLGGSTVSVLLNTTPTSGAALNFASQQPFATGSSSHSVTAADINGDGRPDLIVANAGAGNVSVLLDTTPAGAPTPTFAAQQTFATGTSPYSVKAADINGDGRADLVVANYSDATVSVLLNTTTPGAATPNFAAQQTFATGVHPQSVAIADVNGDGKPDLVVANTSDSTVSVLLNTTIPGAAAPTFAAQVSFVTGATPYAVTTADVNGDGRPDLIVAAYDAVAVSVLLSTTAPGASVPTFTAHQEFPTAASTNPFAITSADINGDGLPDVIVTNYSGTGNPDSVSVLLNTTVPGAVMPGFATQQPFATGAYPFSVTAADVDGDGKVDVIVGNYFDNTASVLLNSTTPGAATPSFAAQQAHACGSVPYSVATADLNGDGRLDLIVANASGSSATILLNTQYQEATAGSPATGTITHDAIFADGFE